MSVQTVNGSVFVDKWNWSGDVNAIDLQYNTDLMDRTSLQDTAHKRVAGLRTVALQLEGMWQGGAGLVDDAIFQEVGATEVPVTVVPTVAAAEGDLAYLFKAIASSYKPGAKVGDLFKFSVSADGTDDLARGQVMTNAIGTPKTATGNGTITQLGAVTSSQKMWAAAHIITVSGTTPSLTLKLQSAAAIGFASPTDRITFNAVTGAASVVGSLAGAVTDAYWRWVYTISGTTPSFAFIASAGIR
jgi:hypothetical protein